MTMGKKGRPDAARQAQLIAELRKDRAQRESSYRERALKLFPHLCARCCREFDGKRLKELTVHHRDHDHNNNPNDGSNWELLCLYCHDHEHEKYKVGGCYDGTREDGEAKPTGSFNPFAGLDSLVKIPEEPPKEEKTESP